MDSVNFDAENEVQNESPLLYHHSTEAYSITSGNAAQAAKNQIQTLLDRGKQKSSALLNDINSSLPKDYGVTPHLLGFMWEDSGDDEESARLAVQLCQMAPDGTRDPDQEIWKGGMSDPAYTKLLAAIGGSKRFFNHLEKTSKGRELLLHNLNNLVKMQQDTVLLLRTCDGEARAFLTENYQRLDSSMILEGFLEELSYLGGVIIDGACAKHSWEIKVLLPQIYEPLTNEVVAFGFSLSNSDYGQGSLNIKMFMYRLWCSNTAVSQDCLRKVHIDKSGMPFQQKWSKATRAAVTASEVAQMRETIRNVVSSESINRMLTTIKRAAEEKISPIEVRKYLKENFSKMEMEAILKSYEEEEDIGKIPAMPGTKYRLSNAITLHSQNYTDPEHRLETEILAGRLIGLDPNPPEQVKGEKEVVEELMEFFPVLEIETTVAGRPEQAPCDIDTAHFAAKFGAMELD